MFDVRGVLKEKRLDDIYVHTKLNRLSVAKDNLELFAMTRFLEDEGRHIFAHLI